MNESSLAKVGAWLVDGSTGNSSISMAGVYLGAPKEVALHHPYDPSDFERCYFFMEECLTLEERVELLQKMADRDGYWKIIVMNWDKLTAHYLEEKNLVNATKTYEFMKKIGL